MIGRAHGAVATYNGSSWVYSFPRPVSRLGDVIAVSCVGPSLCLAAGPSKVALFGGKGWKALGKTPLVSISTVSCATTTFCIAGDEQGDVAILSKAAKKWTWSPPVHV